MSEQLNPTDVPALLHTILFAYQKKLKEVLGSGEAIFVHPVLETLNRIDSDMNKPINWFLSDPSVFLTPTSLALFTDRAVERFIKFMHAITKTNSAMMEKI